MSFRALAERTRQRLHMGERTFKPTPNVRNPAMLQEAEDFAVHMRSYKHALERYDKQLGVFMEQVPIVCRTNLPRVWEAVEGTNMSEPTAPEIAARHSHRTGGDYDESLMADALAIMHHRVKQIVRPIDRWLESLRVVKVRMSKLESLRMEVDARRRRVHKRFLRALHNVTPGQAASMRMQAEVFRGPTSRIEEGEEYEEEEGHVGGGRRAYSARAYESERPRTATGTGGVAAELEEEDDEDLQRARVREDYAREALTQHRQLEAVAETYREQEQLVFDQLSGLVRDAAFFKSYVAAALLVIKDTLQATLLALGPCKLPLPGFSDRTADGALYGRVGDITDLAASLPPVVMQGGRTITAGTFIPGVAPPETIKPTRMTAQPLQVAADDVSPAEMRYEPVAPVVKPASAVPADRLEQYTGSGGEYAQRSGQSGERVPYAEDQSPYAQTAAVPGAFQAMQEEVAY